MSAPHLATHFAQQFQPRLATLCFVGAAIVGADFLVYLESRWHWLHYEQQIAAYHARQNAGAPFEELLRRYAETLHIYDEACVSYHAANVQSGVLAVVVIAAYCLLAREHGISAGFGSRPQQGWRYWILASTLIGLATLVAALPIGGIWLLLGQPLAPGFEDGGDFGETVFFFPVVEEIIFRLAICTPLAAAGRPKLAILVSGVVFALVHLVYGTINPVNLFAGLILAWAFLKSGTILVPIFLHATGNLLVWCVAKLLPFDMSNVFF